MIPEGTILFPETWDCYQMYYDGEPYAYWAGDIGQWVLYKEYDNYRSISHPNDCLCAIGSEELPEGFKQKSLFKLS